MSVSDEAKPKPEAGDRSQAAIAEAIADQSVPQLYANGFSLGLSNADAYVVLQRFGQPVGIINLSYTLAKTLAVKLSTLVDDWEKRTGHQLATTDTIDRAYSPESK